MKKHAIALALAACSAAFLSGCAHDHGAYVPQNTTVHDLENSAPFVLLDPRVQYSVTCDGLQPQRLPDGRLQISANVRNRENRRIQVQINCVFKDGQGFALDETPFQNLFLDKNAQEGVKFVSMNNLAQRYTIRVREAE